MSNILQSIKGKLLGLDSDGRLVAPKGVISGVNGNQFNNNSPAYVALTDEFLGDVLATNWNVVEGTDSATSDCAVLAGGIGGVVRFTTGDAGTGLAADMVQMTSFLNWQASNGDLVFQTRMKLSAITTCYVFLGFTDVITLEAPIESAASANTLTSNATNGVGFMFDTRMTTDNWWLVGVDTDVDATAQDMGSAPVADDYATFRIEVNTDGDAVFFYNGVQVGTKMANAVAPGADLTPTLNVSKTSVAASMTMDVDYVHVAMKRAADGDAT